jgi:regulatory protein
VADPVGRPGARTDRPPATRPPAPLVVRLDLQPAAPERPDVPVAGFEDLGAPTAASRSVPGFAHLDDDDDDDDDDVGDAAAAAVVDAAGASAPRPVVRLEDLAGTPAGMPAAPVAAFGGLAATRPAAGRAARLEDLDHSGPRRRRGAGRGERRAADSVHGNTSPVGDPADLRVPADPGRSDAGPAECIDSADAIEEPRGRRGSRRPVAPAGARTGGRRGGPARGAGELDPDADPVAVAREICLRLLGDRPRTRQELAHALRRRGVPDEAAGTVLERFGEVGLVDDAAFAEQWVRSGHVVRGLGRRALAVELRRRGVADEVAGAALAELDPGSEERRARELVDRKLDSLGVDTAEQRAAAGRRLVGMLARKGYGAGVAYRVVREALAEHGAEADELGAAEASDEV